MMASLAQMESELLVERTRAGLAAAQNKDFKKAVSIWKSLQKDSSRNASWPDIVNRHIETYAKEGGFDPASILPSDPSGR